MINYYHFVLIPVYKKGVFIIITLLGFSFLIVSCTTSENKDHIEYVDKIREIASRKIDAGEAKQALAFFDSAYQTIPHPGIGDEIRKFIFKGHNYYPKIGQYDNALIKLDSIFYLLDNDELKNKYQTEYYGALFQKGDILFNLKHYKEAYQYYYRGKVLAQKANNPCAVSEYSYRFGMVSFKHSKYSEAITNFKESFNDAGLCYKDFIGFAMQQELLSNISLSYDKLNKIDSALYYSHRALKFINKEVKRNPDRKDYLEMAKAVIYGNQSQIHLKTGDTLTAEKLLKKSIKANSKKGFDIIDSQFSMIKLANIYLQRGMFEKAIQTSNLIKSSLNTSYNSKSDLGLRKLSWQLDDKTLQPQKAYISLQKYILLKDSLDQESGILFMSDIDDEFQDIEQQFKYDLLKKGNELKQVYLIVSLIITSLVIVIFLLFWKNWKTSKQNLVKMVKMNQEIVFQNSMMEQFINDLKDSNIDKDRILKVVAHDLRNPIGAIYTIATMLLEDPKFSKEQSVLTELIKTSSSQSIEMINDLLKPNFSYELENMPKLPIDFGRVVIECSAQLRFKAEGKNQHINIDAETNLLVLGNQEKLWRVVSNLLVNSLKFSPSNSKINVGVKRKNDAMHLTIADNGVGIPDELKDKIFDAFSTAKRNGTAGELSYGLGLSISKQIIEAHQGKIWFESSLETGTSFYITLPLLKNSSE